MKCIETVHVHYGSVDDKLCAVPKRRKGEKFVESEHLFELTLSTFAQYLVSNWPPAVDRTTLFRRPRRPFCLDFDRAVLW